MRHHAFLKTLATAVDLFRLPYLDVLFDSVNAARLLAFNSVEKRIAHFFLIWLEFFLMIILAITLILLGRQSTKNWDRKLPKSS